MKRLMCEKNFEDVISEISAMTLEALEEHLDNILGIDKLQLLGVLKERITNEKEILISQNQLPTFSTLARIFKNGMHNL